MTINKPVGLGYIGAWPNNIPASGDLYRAFGVAQSVLDGWPAVEAAIRGNLSLSEQGKRIALASAVADSQTRLNRAMVAVLAAKKQLARDEQALTASPAKGDVYTELRAQEIRDHLGRIEPSQRLEAIRAALSESDPTQADAETLDAVLRAPRCARLVPAAVEKQLNDTLLQRRNPGAVEQNSDMAVAIQTAGYALERASALIAQRAGFTPPVSQFDGNASA
ncbi:MAG: hypothetical protein ACREQR_02625 [Candidatus Binataceae bacterium]